LTSPPAHERLFVTPGAAITSLRRAMAGATQLVADSAKKMASLSVVGLKVGLGAAPAGVAAALAAGIQAVTSARISSTPRVACAIVSDDALKAVQTLAQLRERGAKTPFEFPEPADAGRRPIAFEEGAPVLRPLLRNRLARRAHPPPAAGATRTGSTLLRRIDVQTEWFGPGDEGDSPLREQPESLRGSGLRKIAIDPPFVLPNRAGSVSREQNQMNLRPEENPLPATEA
jgi:hypothetical protein